MPDDVMWYATVLLFGAVAPFILRNFQDRIQPRLREYHQSLVLSLIWLGIQLTATERQPDKVIVAGWLFIYAYGSLVLLYGRIGDK